MYKAQIVTLTGESSSVSETAVQKSSEVEVLKNQLMESEAFVDKLKLQLMEASVEAERIRRETMVQLTERENTIKSLQRTSTPKKETILPVPVYKEPIVSPEHELIKAMTTEREEMRIMMQQLSNKVCCFQKDFKWKLLIL